MLAVPSHPSTSDASVMISKGKQGERKGEREGGRARTSDHNGQGSVGCAVRATTYGSVEVGDALLGKTL